MTETVVITGIGVESALGRGLSTHQAGLFADSSALSEVGSEDDPLWLRWAGRTADPTVPESIADRLRGEGRFLNRGGLLGLQVAVQAMTAAGTVSSFAPHERSLYLATGDLTTADCSRLHPALRAATKEFTATINAQTLNRTTVEKVYPFYLLETLANNPFSALASSFELMGPGTTVSSHSPCGAQALELAWRSLRHGRTRQALVVACGSWVSVLPQIELHGLGLLSPAIEGPSSFCPLDARRNGFIAGEGAVALVLETQSGAEDRGASPVATIEAMKQAIGPDAQDRVLEQVISEAGLSVAEIGCVIAHGDGSRDGDRAELESLSRLLSATCQPPPIAAIKAATGHLGAASDLLEVVAAVSAVRTGQVPPTLHFQLTDSDFSHLPIAARPQGCAKPTALTLSRGLGGQHSAIVVGAASPT